MSTDNAGGLEVWQKLVLIWFALLFEVQVRSLPFSVKKASDFDGLCDVKSLLFSAICCNVLLVLTKASRPLYWFQTFLLPTLVNHLQITVLLLAYASRKVV